MTMTSLDRPNDLRTVVEKSVALIINRMDHGTLQFGDTIPHDELLKLGGFTAADKMTMGYTLGFLHPLIETLRLGHKVWLRNVFGDGYKLVHPKDQATLATEDLNEGLRREIRRATSIVTNTRTNMLSQEENEKRIDTLARFGAIRAVTRKQLR